MKIGVLGGSGLYSLDGIENLKKTEVETPFGKPSDAIVQGTLNGREVCFLPRHGRGHRILPSEINHKANIYALKTLGVDRVVSVSAVGSLREEYRPRDIVLPDQYYDRTKGALDHTFFGRGLVAHIGFSEPACPAMREQLAGAAQAAIAAAGLSPEPRVHVGGTYVNMEGPAFSTKAESHIYRQLGCDVIGMTSLPEAKLCREAEMCYQAMAMVTDYDCWRESEEAVSVESIYGHLTANTALAKAALPLAFAAFPEERSCVCANALANALMTVRDVIPKQTLYDLKPIVGEYFNL